jgi:hypothetical protein
MTKKASKKSPPAPTELSSRAEKRSISLYATDLARLDKIKAYMAGKGVRSVTDSSALRLACRAVTLGPKLLEIFETMKAEDGRRVE